LKLKSYQISYTGICDNG